MVVTFCNGTFGEYPVAPITVKIDGSEYSLMVAVVQDLVEEVLLGRDVPLCKHMLTPGRAVGVIATVGGTP